MTVSEYIVNYLEKHGIDNAFGVTGSASMWLFHALGSNKGIRTVFTNHEQAAAMAADGWSNLTGKPGVVFLTNGPGVTNALSGVVQAWTDSVPMLIINGESNTFSIHHENHARIRQYGSQSIATSQIVSPMVKYYHLLDKAEDTRKTIEEAYDKALAGRPGPVWISVPIDIQNAQVPETMEAYEKPNEVRESFDGPIAEIKGALLAAKRPLIIAGQGVRLSGAVAVFQSLVEKFEIPVVTARMGNDVMESENPLFIGRPGNWGSRAAHFAIQTADVILVLGCRLSLNTTGHTPSAFAPQAKKFMVDVDEAEFNKPGIQWELCVHEDAAMFLAKMEAAAAPDQGREARRKWCARCLAWKKRYPVMVPEYSTAFPMSTYHFVERLSALASENDVILSDTGSCCNIVSQVWNVKKGQRLRVSGGLSCMGYWATAIGMARANEKCDGNVICVVGDGSFQMNIQELGTLVHYKLPVKLFVINNNGYQIIRISQKAYLKGDFFGVSPETGVGLANLERVAAAYGIAYRKVEKPEEVDAAIQWALSSRETAILEAVVSEDQQMFPRLTSKVQPDGTLKSAAFDDLAPFLDADELKRNLEV